MTRVLLALAVAAIALPMAAHAQTQESNDADKDTVFRAMADELDRSVRMLKMEKVERPYYIEYAVVEGSMVDIFASFGALIGSTEEKGRFLLTDVRVGDYALDNTNFSGEMMGFLGMAMAGGSPGIVIEDDYDALRHAIWLATDATYKEAAETLAQKKGVLKRLTIQDRPDDLTMEEPYVHIGDPYVLDLDREEWERRIARHSAAFKEFPKIQESAVSFHGRGGTQRFINSEGFRHRYGDGLYGVRFDASAQAGDGMEVGHAASIYAHRMEDLPSEEEVTEAIRALAGDVTKMAEAERGEEYTGPVLLEGQAAAEFFVQLFLKNISDPREPLSEAGGAGAMMRGMMPGAELSEKVGKKVMAEFLDVVDDPTISEFEGHPLIGGYPVDDDGVKPQKITLVKDGKLLTLPMSRVPTREVKGSNGHARGTLMGAPTANPSNVIIRASDGLSDQDLRNKMIDLCREEGLDYGIVIPALEVPPAGGGMPDLSFLRNLFSGGPGRSALSAPALAYRVYVEDGRVEPTRGLRFSGVGLRALRDILAAGERLSVHSLLYTGRNPLAGIAGGIPVSVVAPSILLEDIDLKKVPPQAEKPPYLPHPHFGE